MLLPIRVLCRIFANAISFNRDIGEDHIRAIGNQVVPLRRVAKVQIRNGTAMQTNGSEKDRTKDVNVHRVGIVPDLTVPVDCSATEYIHIFAAELEEGSRVLEGLVEGVLRPVSGVVGELDGALNI
jgi:hypothetical protein